MRKFLFSTLLFLVFISTQFYSYTSLRVLDPRAGWWSFQNGTIEEATLSVKPKGLYLEYGLYLTFSARDTYFSANDTLEVEMRFDLPENAIVTDMWLWIEDEIMQALIFDRWTASSIYEDIVKRRRDPAILFKNGNQNYELRVFPMAAKETRKVKLTYLVPMDWNNSLVSSKLPMDILKSSSTPLQKLDLLYFPEKELPSLKILEDESLQFESKYDSTYGNYKHAELNLANYDGELTVAAEFTSDDGIFVTNYEKDGEGFYQFAIMPSIAFDLNTNKNVAVMLDFDQNHTQMSTSQFMSNIKSLFKNNLSEKDSFNIFYIKQLNATAYSDTWIQATSDNIDSAFNKITSLANYSNIPALFSKAVEFFNNNQNGQILFFGNSSQVGDYKVANQLLRDIQSNFEKLPVITVVDYHNYNTRYFYINNRSYIGNEYFYDNLTRQSGGNYYKDHYYWATDFYKTATSGFASLNGEITAFDLYSYTADGFCYGRYDLQNYSDNVLLSKPIIQVGKYMGNFPITIQASGIFRDKVFSKKIVKGENPDLMSDSIAVNVWIGNHISALEKKPYSNSIINEIIDASLSNRVLSIYTAFLALEPNDTIKFCTTCDDESGIGTSVEEENATSQLDTLMIQAYPNPFNSTTKIKVVLPQDFDFDHSSIKIYNILGEAVRNFDLNELSGRKSFEVNWNGKNDGGIDVASGVYLFTISSPKNTKTLKLLLIK